MASSQKEGAIVFSIQKAGTLHSQKMLLYAPCFIVFAGSICRIECWSSNTGRPHVGTGFHA
jgi:hypothetical protein